jgi:hypothetical protein
VTEDQEQQLIRESSRGAKASALLQSAIYREAMEKVEAGILESWKSSPVRDVEGQTYLRLMMKVLTDIKAHIKDVAETGKMASVQLEHERSLAQRAKDAVRAFRRTA